MSQPIVRRSVEDATETTEGSAVRSLGHYHVGLFVAVDDEADLNDLRVQMEVSPDGQRWAPVQKVSGGSTVDVTTSELDADPSSGEDTAMLTTPGVYADFVRARVADYDGSATVNAWVMLGGNAGQGRKASSRKGPVTDLDL